MKKISLLFSTLVFPFYLLADITGLYHISGFDPVTKHNYSGSLTIEKEKAIYTAVWTFSDGSVDTGTGIKKGDHISFVYQEPPGLFGVQQYEIDHDRLKGPWVLFDTTRRGFEKAKKVDSSYECSSSSSSS